MVQLKFLKKSHFLVSVDNYAKDGGQGRSDFFSFYHEPLRPRIKTNVNKFGVLKLYGFEIRYTGSKKLFEATL